MRQNVALHNMIILVAITENVEKLDIADASIGWYVGPLDSLLQRRLV